MPTVVLVGRPNVGKSTLFNKLTRSRDALVADVPGLTRDRRYGRWQFDGREVTLVDTGGLFGDHEMADVLAEQTRVAVDEADLVVLMLDGRSGPTPVDEAVIHYLRKGGRDFLTVINKVDGQNADVVTAEFARLGLDEPLPIAASHGRGIGALTKRVGLRLPARDEASDADAFAEADGVRVALVGRPNVGKSTLVNRLVGEERQVVFDMPGTTKDAIDVPFSRDGVDYVLIDTAGVRRKGKVSEVTEKFSVVKSLDAMNRADVVILVIDATEGIVDQDLHILTYAVDAGCALVLAINKWDGLTPEQKDRTHDTIDRRLDFVPWMPVRRISALHGTGVGHLLKAVDEVYAAGEFDVTTSHLTRLVRNLVEHHPTPSVQGRSIKIKMASRGGAHPPRVVVHGNQLKSLPASYRRYLENGIREGLNLIGNPVVIEYRDSDNPFKGRKNQLSDRQTARRGRLIKKRKERQKRRLKK